MATQMQPTPTLYGKDAREVCKQIEKKPTKEQLRKAKERSDYYAQIRKKNF